MVHARAGSIGRGVNTHELLHAWRFAGLRPLHATWRVPDSAAVLRRAPQQPRPTPRPVAQQPKPQPSRPASVALPPLEPVALKPVELPPPEVLGIRLDDPLVAIPAPEKLGIKLD